jgi:hypothetical protein
MKRTESWAFLCLMGCLLLVVFSFTLLSGSATIIGSLLAAALGVLSGGLYAASVKKR